LYQKYSYQKLSKSDNWFSSYSRKCQGWFFGTQCTISADLVQTSRTNLTQHGAAKPLYADETVFEIWLQQLIITMFIFATSHLFLHYNTTRLFGPTVCYFSCVNINAKSSLCLSNSQPYNFQRHFDMTFCSWYARWQQWVLLDSQRRNLEIVEVGIVIPCHPIRCQRSEFPHYANTTKHPMHSHQGFYSNSRHNTGTKITAKTSERWKAEMSTYTHTHTFSITSHNSK